MLLLSIYLPSFKTLGAVDLRHDPLGGLLEQKNDEGTKELQCIKTTLLASMQGYAPQVAVEFGRKVLYSADRPTFAELESHVKGRK